MNHPTHYFTSAIGWVFGLSALIGLLASTGLLLFR